MMTDPDDKMVDRLLSDVAQTTAPVDDALMARVLADAARMQAAPAPAKTPGLFQQLQDLLGGWPGLGGVALAGIAGLWIGAVPPLSVENLAADLIGTTDTISLGEDTNWLFDEEALDG